MLSPPPGLTPAPSQDKQAQCARPVSGCAVAKTGAVCNQWHGCQWRSAKCINDNTCSLTPAGTKAPVATKSPTISFRDCIDIPQLPAGCGSATSLQGCEKYYCCTWYADNKCRVTGQPSLPGCATYKTNAACSAVSYCRFSQNKCITRAAG